MLAQTPSCCSGPVSFDVRPHSIKSVHCHGRSSQTARNPVRNRHWALQVSEHQKLVESHVTCPPTSLKYAMVSVAAAGKSFQFIVGAARQRAAPRSQSFGAAHVALCHSIGYRGPLNLDGRSEVHQKLFQHRKMKKFIFPAFVQPQTIQTVRPNQSLNRTLHSMPAFGLAFHASPNTVLLFRAG